jgi:bacillithiol biosynthesis cysteine-adding enzyme BshC
MTINPIDYSAVGLWSHTDLAYIQHDPAINEYLQYVPGNDSLVDIISERKKFPVNRTLLVDVLRKQYSRLGIALPSAIEALRSENCFTVTTAHQPVLFTGPLYHIFKIASTIHLARKHNETNKEATLVPVFVMSGEDHDWAEVNHAHIFGKKYIWEREAGGPCGRLDLQGLEPLIESVTSLFANSQHYEEIKTLFQSSLSKAKNYGDFHHLLVHALFGHHGLVVLNADDPELKRVFAPVMKREIEEQFSFPHVTRTQKELEAKGFKPQAFCRPINLFYLSEGRRERLEPENGRIRLMETGKSLEKDELLKLLEQTPESFSPNVIMRPLYQEMILPNLAYIGGGGEIAYWLERKSQFNAVGLHFPMLIRRNSVMIIDAATDQQLKKSSMTWLDLMDDYDTIVRKYLKAHSQAELDYDQEQKLIHDAYAMLASKAEKIDPTLAKAILAEETKQVKAFEQLGSRLIRAEKQQQETQLKRIHKLKEKLFPGGGLQERYENFLPYYAEQGDAWIETMIHVCDPMVEKFIVLEP